MAGRVERGRRAHYGLHTQRRRLCAGRRQAAGGATRASCDRRTKSTLHVCSTEPGRGRAASAVVHLLWVRFKPPLESGSDASQYSPLPVCVRTLSPATDCRPACASDTLAPRHVFQSSVRAVMVADGRDSDQQPPERRLMCPWLCELDGLTARLMHHTHARVWCMCFRACRSPFVPPTPERRAVLSVSWALSAPWPFAPTHATRLTIPPPPPMPPKPSIRFYRCPYCGIKCNRPEFIQNHMTDPLVRPP